MMSYDALIVAYGHEPDGNIWSLSKVIYSENILHYFSYFVNLKYDIKYIKSNRFQPTTMMKFFLKLRWGDQFY